MTNEITQKKMNVVEWTVDKSNIPLYAPVVSDTFSLQGRKCHFELSYCGPDDYRLRYESSGVLQPPATGTICVLCHPDDARPAEEVYIDAVSGILWQRIRYGATIFNIHLAIDVDHSTDDLTASSGENVVSEDSQTSLGPSIHLEALSRDFSKLLEGSSCDVEIRCEGKTFNAHRIILETRSSVFSAMLKSNMVEGKTGLINVEDIDAPILQGFLSYLYSGTLPELSTDSAVKFYEIGDKYAVEELKKACSEFLTKNLSEDSACEALVLADQHGDQDFRKNIISYIVDKKIPQRVECWSVFCENHSKLAVEVLNVYVQKNCSNKII